MKPEVYATAATTNSDLQTAQNQLATEKRLSFKRPTDFLGATYSVINCTDLIDLYLGIKLLQVLPVLCDHIAVAGGALRHHST